MKKDDLDNLEEKIKEELERIENEIKIDLNSDNLENLKNNKNIDNPKRDKLSIFNFRRYPKWLKITGTIFLIMIFIGIGSIIYLRGLASKFQYEDPESIATQEEEFDVDIEDDIDIEEETEPIILETIDNPNGPRYNNNIINILLIGEDKNPGGGGRGRADVIIIATIDKNDKALKLTSIMRDTYVQIPDYRPNKINAAFSIGGAPLLVDTIERNFDIRIDGYAWTKFDDFEVLIDKLGGVGITLSSTEANYLNRTNYISKSKYRNVKEGYQMLNGSQALGYCRIRYVGNSDFERTNRQRKVLVGLFDKYKTISLGKALESLDYILPQVRTNMMPADIINTATTVVTLGAKEVDTLRLPTDKGYQSKRVDRMAVLLPDLKLNISELHKFIFGSERSVESE